nr:alpha/beta fold hydrolase [uncultured Methanospirillum sp.]
MIINRFNIGTIPAVLWGDTCDKILIAVHGYLSHKEDIVIQLLAREATDKSYQVLSFDLPEHGDRRAEDIPCKVQFCIRDLAEVMRFVKEEWKEISLFACSMGAYFSLLAYKNEPLNKALFLSPVVDMERIISNMMTWFQVTPGRLQKEQTIDTPIGQKLYWDYFCYVRDHPVDTWNVQTSILYGTKDEICESDTIRAFTEKFHCNLTIMENSEHYVHTKEQLKVYSDWLQTNMR